MQHFTIAAAVTSVVGLALVAVNFWAYPTQDGLTIGVGSYGYHIQCTNNEMETE